eukprot:scaffold26446_cov40-Phaeocystis_antarctica.AAC.1
MVAAGTRGGAFAAALAPAFTPAFAPALASALALAPIAPAPIVGVGVGVGVWCEALVEDEQVARVPLAQSLAREREGVNQTRLVRVRQGLDDVHGAHL